MRKVPSISGYELQAPVQSVDITTKVASSNPAHGEVYSMRHYVIMLVGDLRHVGGFLLVLWSPPPIKVSSTNKTDIGLTKINKSTTIG